MSPTPYYFLRRDAELQRISVGGDPLRVTGIEPVGPIGPEWKLNMSFPFNGTGYADIVGRNDAGDLGLWIADGHGQFSDPRVFGNIGNEWELQFARFRRGGAINVLAHYRGGDGRFIGRVQIYEMNGLEIGPARTFEKIIFPDWQLYPGDFDGDGILDILGVRIRTDAPRDLHLWFVDDSGRMRDELNIGAIGPEWTLDVADMNLDGCADLVGTTAQNDLGIWINEGAAGDRTHRRLVHRNIGKLGLEWQQLVFADVDRDQRFDLIAQSKDGSIGLWKWNGTTLQPNPDDIGRAPAWTVYAGGGHLR